MLAADETVCLLGQASQGLVHVTFPGLIVSG
jgi:hypothetical protein